MFKRQLSHGIRSALLLAVVTMAATFVIGQQQPLPDAPKPQNNAPPASLPDVTAPLPGASDDAGTASQANPQDSANTRSESEQPQGAPGSNPPAPPPGSEGIKTVPSGPKGNAPGNDFDELFTLSKDVNFISVPVTVKDAEGKLIDGLLAQDFSVYEDNVKQAVTFFTSDPFPLSAALVIDLGISDTTLKKVQQTFSALDGSFGPFDKVAVFTFGNYVQKQSDFGNAQRLTGLGSHLNLEVARLEHLLDQLEHLRLVIDN